MFNSRRSRRRDVDARSRALSGPSFLAKAVLGKALRNSRWVKKKQTKQIEFTLDRRQLGAVRDRAA